MYHRFFRTLSRMIDYGLIGVSFFGWWSVEGGDLGEILPNCPYLAPKRVRSRAQQQNVELCLCMCAYLCL